MHPQTQLYPIIPYNFNPAAFAALSPSTSTHHPSLPRPPSPPTAASKSFNAPFKISSSNVPGCSHTLLIPSFLASSSTSFVIFGGVMIDTEVWVGSGRAVRFGKVAYSLISFSGHGGYALMVEEEGLMGVTVSLWCVYQVNTVLVSSHPFVLPLRFVGASLEQRKAYSCAQTLWDHCSRPQPQNTAQRRILLPQLQLPSYSNGCPRRCGSCGWS